MFLPLVALGIIAGLDVPAIIKAKDVSGFIVFAVIFVLTLIFSFLIYYEISFPSTINLIAVFFKSIGLSYE